MATAQVSALSILFMIVTLLICFGLPFALAIWASGKFKKSFSFVPLFAGVLAFIVSQLLIRQTINASVLPLFGWYQQLMQMPWLYAAFLSITAGLVEEPARFIAFSIMQKRRSFPDGLAYGIGHGGIEAIIFIGFTYINNLVISSAINSGAASTIPSLTPNIVSIITTTPSYLFLTAGIERIFAISLQIALSLFVLKGFQVNKKWLYLLIAILLHGLANFIALALTKLGAAVLPNSPTLGAILFSEGFLLIVAILSILFIVKQARGWFKSRQAAELPLAAQDPAA